MNLPCKTLGRLQTRREETGRFVKTLTLEVVSVDPVEDVEPPVGAEREQVVRGDGLGLPGLGHHEELRQDGHGLQVDGERPQHLHHAELVVQDQGEQQGGQQQELNSGKLCVKGCTGFKIKLYIFCLI